MELTETLYVHIVTTHNVTYRCLLPIQVGGGSDTEANHFGADFY